MSCVPATLTTRRRRRFPERELLEKLRRYEDLLRQNQINFEPLHPNSTENREKDGSDDEQAEETGMGGGSSPTTVRSSLKYKNSTKSQAPPTNLEISFANLKNDLTRTAIPH